MAHSDTSSDTVVMVTGDDRVVNQGNDNTFSVEDEDDGNDDSITGSSNDGSAGIVISNTLDTGNGKDSITGDGGTQGIGILNDGTIFTGNGKDFITGSGFIGISNNGIIFTGRGNDIVDAFDGGFDGDGGVFLGRGDDTLLGFGTGWFYGGKGEDTLVLPSDSYSVGFAAIDDKVFVTFTLGDFTMNVIGFESLIIGNNTYDFADLTEGTISG
ncbi:hypothetical protein [Pseudanabaena sp. PCC 6802]|uniref:hypothetical protein n=1 Tax=Pseudanabaena sp. PCC 6802 TaxID=118173 RepID=UPI000363C106|nr:hypothetical protein [Pseudanabaena sp. PCC 6802]